MYRCTYTFKGNDRNVIDSQWLYNKNHLFLTMKEGSQQVNHDKIMATVNI